MISTSSSAVLGRKSVRVALGAVITAGSVALLVGCGAGQVNTIGNEVSAVNGATGHLRQLDILNAAIAYPSGDAHAYQPGQSAPLVFTISNIGVQSDKLVSISSSAAQKVTLKGAQDLPGGTKLVARTSGSADEPATLTATMEGLTTTIQPGPTVDVTFTFDRAGAVTLPLPVGAPPTAR